ncbi:MAG: hypothetical protein Q7T33_02220 [Dehalococcoidia bacterium]|nr:hypothetical protein [Dehalococcoidia bacterium]
MADDYVAELMAIIRVRFPDAEFQARRIGPKDYQLIVYGGYDIFAVLDLISERRTDILLEAGIHIVVLPLGRRAVS